MFKGNLLNQIKKIGKKYQVHIYLVGGPLRDKILSRKTKDIDILVDKLIPTVGSELAKILNAKFQYYQDFNTGTITLNDQHIDIAQTRKEIYPQPGVLPKVFPADLISDLYRRDFTINAMAQDLTTGELIDPYQGLKDLKKRVIRVLHAKSFIDDPTRIFRAIRFAERFNFKIEPNTLKWLRAAIKQKLPSLLSGERILNEIRLIVKETKCERMIERLNQAGLFESLFGKKLPRPFFQQFSKVEKSADANLKLIHILAQFDSLNNFPITKQESAAIRDWQRFPQIRKLLLKVRRPSEIYKILKGFSNEALGILVLVEDKSINLKIKNYQNRYRKVNIQIGGDDIKALGINPGVIYGKLLEDILFARLDGKVKTRADELRLLKKMIAERRVG
jgi:tRNA nucleotidyltransferase (CCA-adding enzyme)